MGRKDDLRKEKRAKKREKIQKIQKMKTRKLGRIREELKNRKGEDEDGCGKWRDVI